MSDHPEAGTTPDRRLAPGLVAVALVVSVIGSLGASLITAVATSLDVSLDAAQWTLTITLFTGAIAGPVLGRLGSGPHRRTTILVTLGLVALGGLVTTAPLPFGFLLAGRGLQGLGLGVVALLMGVARDRLPADRSASTIAALSVASTVGIGVGYPVVGLVNQVAGLRTAYGLGLALSLAAMLAAWRVVPRDTPGPPVRVDVPGAVLLALGTIGLLLVVAHRGIWDMPGLGVAAVVAAFVALGTWVLVERRTAAPLVDVRLLTHPAVLRANVAMLVAGAGMYLLFSLLTRYVQTPPGAGYGFGLPGVLAGAALIPFSVFGFVAARTTLRALTRFGERTVYAGAAVAVGVAAAVLAVASGSLVAVLAAMALLGFGTGGVSAVMPRLVLAGVPRPETTSVLSINQLIRSIGFSLGSALAGLLLAASTARGELLPSESGYRQAALWVLPLLAVSLVTLSWRRRR